METPLNASSTTAGTLISSSRFSVPQFQREYAWEEEEVEEFWSDLRNGLEGDMYFLGLIILTTGSGDQKDIVDGQQRLLTVTLLAAALYHEALSSGRRALAERLQSTFLRSIDFESDQEFPRLKLTGAVDNATLERILRSPFSDVDASVADIDSVSRHLLDAYRIITERLRSDIQPDPFKRLGIWADFITNRLYFANFIHPDPASAYKVFEVVNTRGKELTTADLLKSYVLSQTSPHKRQQRYEEWQRIAAQFSGASAGVFVQFIRHAVTVERGHVLPKDLYDVLAGDPPANQQRMGPDQLMQVLERHLPLYLQMTDPTSEGPADLDQLSIFSALNRIGVIAVRPILLAMEGTQNGKEGMAEMLRLVVRRIIVGNLGTGNIERRFGRAAELIHKVGAWEPALKELADLVPPQEDFVIQSSRRSFNKGVLTLLRQSILQETIAPEPIGFLHFVRPRQAAWPAFSDESAAFWVSTIGNTLLASDERRPKGTSTWGGFKKLLLPKAVEGEWKDRIMKFDTWDEHSVKSIGEELAVSAGEIWYA